MKERIAIIIFTIIFIAACSSPSSEETKEAGGADEQEKSEANEAEEGGIEVDKGLFNVEVTLPSSLFEETEMKEIEAEMKEEANADVTKNEDGSITVKMSKKDHKKMITEMKEDFIETIHEIVEDDDFVSIKDITYNKDFTEINMIVEQEAFENSFDGFVTLSLGIGSLFYQAFNGKDLEKEKVFILVEDEATSEVFSEITYPDVMDEMEDE